MSEKKATAPGTRPAGEIGLAGIMDLPLRIEVVLGRARMRIEDLVRLTPGSMIELDQLGSEPLELLVNGRLMARGEIVVVNERYGIRITELVAGSDGAAGGGAPATGALRNRKAG